MSKLPNIERGLRGLIARAEPPYRIPVRDEFSDGTFRLYARVGLRPVATSVMIPMIQIADVGFKGVVPDPGQGRLRATFDIAETLAHETPWIVGVYVESVNNAEVVVPFLRRRGYTQRPYSAMPHPDIGDYFWIKHMAREAASVE